MIQNAHLVFVPSAGLSDIIPTVELAKRLLRLNPLFSVTFLVIPGLNRDPIESIITNSAPCSIRFILLPPADLPPPATEPGVPFFSIYVQNYHPLIKQHLTRLISDDSPVRLILNLFSSTLVDVAKHLSIPSYLFFTPPASLLGLMLHLPALDSLIKSEFRDHSPELILPSYINPVPTLSFPACLNKKTHAYRWFLTHCQNIARSHAIIANSASDLQFCAFNQMAATNTNIPPVYFCGPILNLDGNACLGSDTAAQSDRIMSWLDKQPVASVVFLCFGTRGALTAPQLIELATGLERSRQRFLWSIRSPPDDCSNLEEVMPHGFMDRVGERGMLCGWAPQVKILGHKGVGAFVTHCGWNSILESVWFGVPMLTWPLYAEQKLNAFEVVMDLGIASELKREGVEVVPADVVERSVRGIIEGERM